MRTVLQINFLRESLRSVLGQQLEIVVHAMHYVCEILQVLQTVPYGLPRTYSYEKLYRELSNSLDNLRGSDHQKINSVLGVLKLIEEAIEPRSIDNVGIARLDTDDVHNLLDLLDLLVSERFHLNGSSSGSSESTARLVQAAIAAGVFSSERQYPKKDVSISSKLFDFMNELGSDDSSREFREQLAALRLERLRAKRAGIKSALADAVLADQIIELTRHFNSSRANNQAASVSSSPVVGVEKMSPEIGVVSVRASAEKIRVLRE